MKYRILRREERCIIIDGDDEFGTSRKITPNLEANELQINSLLAENCPIHSNCVSLNGWGCSSICSYNKGPWAEDNEDQVFCRFGEPTMFRKILSLSAGNCTKGKANCITCEYRGLPIIPVCSETGEIKKSHAYITCRAIPDRE